MQAGDQGCWEGRVVLKEKLHRRQQVEGSDYPPLLSTCYSIAEILHPILDPPIKTNKKPQTKKTPTHKQTKPNHPNRTKLESNRKIPTAFTGHWLKEASQWCSSSFNCYHIHSGILDSEILQLAIFAPTSYHSGQIPFCSSNFFSQLPFFPHSGAMTLHICSCIGFSLPLALRSRTSPPPPTSKFKQNKKI